MLRIGALALLSIAVPAETHHLAATPKTVVWGHYSAATPPVLRVRDGDSVVMETVSGNPARLEAAGLAAGEIPEALRAINAEVKDRGPGGHILTGPLFIEGAEPGDTLEVRIKAIEMPVAWAYNSFRPGAGFLPDEFPFARTKIIRLDRARGVARFAPGIEIPLRPFFGSLGVAPPEANGRVNSGPPWIHAGNMDNKELVAGTKLYVPVHASGALFQAGDGHAGQGDGEVDITALETPLTGTFEFHVLKNRRIKWPRAETPSHWIAMGFHEELKEAAQIALREALDFLQEKGLSREDAYMLASVAVDLRITQLVDGKVGVHAVIPKALFTGGAR